MGCDSYPLYERGGHLPQQVLMLRRAGQWQYITLQRQSNAQPCFTAVFTAERFTFTRDWLAKYRPQAGAAAD